MSFEGCLAWRDVLGIDLCDTFAAGLIGEAPNCLTDSIPLSSFPVLPVIRPSCGFLVALAASA
jgi:hypothetical protein